MEKSIPIFNFKGAKLSSDHAQKLAALILNSNKEKSLNKDEILSGEFPSQVFLKRINAYNLPFMVSNFFFLMSMLTFMQGNPGRIMIQLWLCHQEWKRTGRIYFNINDWCSMFPFGTPTEDECLKFWDSQKNPDEPLGNMVDNPEYWK